MDLRVEPQPAVIVAHFDDWLRAIGRPAIGIAATQGAGQDQGITAAGLCQADRLPEMGAQLVRLFGRQQRLYERFALPDSMNERIAEEVALLVENALL